MTVNSLTANLDRIAIVGVGGIFPGARDLNSFWQNIAAGVDSGRAVPDGRWSCAAEHAYAPGAIQSDRAYSTWGCYLDDDALSIAELGQRLPADLLAELDTLDPLFHIGLLAADRAWQDAGRPVVAADRVGTIFGHIVLPTESTSALARQQLLSDFARSSGLTNLGLPQSMSNWSAKNWQAAGWPAALISAALGFRGPAFTLDAACASSLYALKLACDELHAGRADVMLAGGLSRPDCQYTQMGFSQLQALSKSGQCAPLSAAADGLVVGEGAGLFVLKRLADAVAQGDHIYATIAGIGLSNDRGANLLAPHSEGQLRAMRAAYLAANWQPDDVDLMECHATGTPVGDAVELQSLQALWRDTTGRAGRCVLGSVKSNVGHLLTGAGAASLMKLLFAFREQTLPPTANFVTPANALQSTDTPFRVLAAAEPWPVRSPGVPRRAAINAFGFGGINAHVLLEEWPNQQSPTHPPAARAPAPVAVQHSVLCPPSSAVEIAIVGMSARLGTVTNLRDCQQAWFQSATAASEHSPSTPTPDQFTTALAEVRVPLGEFRIPPLELADILPQQQLMLLCAAEALQDAGVARELGDQAGVFVGISLDPNTTNFHCRWMLAEQAAQWARQQGHELSPEALTRWTAELREAFGPPLTANRVMGNLGGIVASRLGREFDVGGPCFTISSDTESGLRALETAVRALQRGELDRALVGAVDLRHDVRLQAGVEQSDGPEQNARPHVTQPPVDGAVALFLKRRADAERDGDRIYAILSDQDHPGPTTSTNAIELTPDSLDAGAVTSLLPILQSALSLYQRMTCEPVTQPWLINRESELRQQTISRTSPYGTQCWTLTEALKQPRQRCEIEWRQPLGELPAALFSLRGNSPREILAAVENLHADSYTGGSLEALARAWWHRWPTSNHEHFTATIVAQSQADLRAKLQRLRTQLEAGQTAIREPGIAFTTHPLARQGQLAFVFPGSGNHFLGMGRELLTTFSELHRQQADENLRLRSQYRPDLIWNAPSTEAIGRDHKAMIFGQVALGTAVCDWLRALNIQPSVSLGYSLGESAAFFGLRAWRDRDEMLRRMEASALFGSDLPRPFDAARRAWSIPDDQDVPWLSGMIDRGPEVLRPIIERTPRLYLLIVNTPTQCVIGGDRAAVEQLVRDVGGQFVPFPAPSTVHCEILAGVSQSYLDLHDMPTTPLPDVTFYSTASGQPYALSRESAREALLAQALNTVDFPRVVQNAYRTGVRLFLEIGPGSSCTKFISEILSNEPHAAWALCPATSQPITQLLRVLGELIAQGVPVDLTPLYGLPTALPTHRPVMAESRAVVTSVERRYGPWPNLPATMTTTIPAKMSDAQPALLAPVTKTPRVTPLPAPAPVARNTPRLPLAAPRSESLARRSPISSPTETPMTLANSVNVSGDPVLEAWDEWMTANVAAHEAFLRFSHEAQSVAVEMISQPGERLKVKGLGTENTDATGSPLPLSPQPSTFNSQPTTLDPTANAAGSGERLKVKGLGTENTDAAGSPLSLSPQPSTLNPQPSPPPRSLNYEQCLEFAIGKIGQALGPMFAEIDQFPTRVRLPDVPLMLCDRILEIEGEPLSMTSGRVVTEKDITADDWYLDCGRIPTCLAVESGQADLFLSGWLGIDLQTRGLASYRLLDAVVTFHDALPGPGSTIRYDIRINHFFRQGETYLFRFEFDATVNGRPLLTMRDGCAGFFTQQELNAGQGIIQTTLDRQPQPGVRPDDWTDLVPMQVEQYDDGQLAKLRQGDLAAAFGPAFRDLPLSQPVTLPSGRLNLVHRVLRLDPTAGKYGMGQILAEADIHPDDWFLTCHFCDDQVMPGTLMYECCLHTLRVYLLRMGWIGETGEVAYEPIPGIKSRLKCRGQVLATTKKVWYEVTLKEIGYGAGGRLKVEGLGTENPNSSGPSPSLSPQPLTFHPSVDSAYAIANALMYADGKPIVEITDMTVRLSGLTRERVEALWSGERLNVKGSGTENASMSASSPPLSPQPSTFNPQPLFDTDRITAFAIGKPSDAFGDRYQVFDHDRKIARLPGPPFQFLDRITAIRDCEPWVLAAGGTIVAEYDVPADAWYFAANRSRTMPFAVLLETALQPCGWLAGYLGSALTSETDLKFRNLGGTATQFQEVTPQSGTLTTTVKITRVSQSAGMIIQHYDYDLRCHGQPVYVGNTYFGFFSAQALANQVGIRDAVIYQPSEAELSRARQFPVSQAPPFPDAEWDMVRRVDGLLLDGGPHGFGWVRGSVDVDPGMWFFKAHFFEDPVWPGSLGLESFLQLMQVYAAERFGQPAGAISPWHLSLGRKHEWLYRGQVIPQDRTVTVDVVVTAVDEATRTITANGFLTVDGRVIYQMTDFCVTMQS